MTIFIFSVIILLSHSIMREYTILFKVRKYLTLTITLSVIVGFLYYYFLRHPVVGLSWLGIEKVETLNTSWSTYFLWFPTFIHPFIFSLLSW